MNIHAIIPARKGSKRFKNKNITKFMGIALFQHSINFATKLKFITTIIFSTDSKSYIRKVKKKSKIIIHPRSHLTSKDNSMEEDILYDLKKFYKKNKMELPDAILWLRPTSPLRSLKVFKKAFDLYKKSKNSTLIVHETDSRLFYSKKSLLFPLNKKMKNKSMLRGQNSKPFYKIFSGEFFKFPKKYNINFLGNKKNYVVAPKETNFDIDNIDDLNILELMIKKSKHKYKNFIHEK